ncbi:MAG: class I SAM-dependent methyltransferase [Tetrasphaera sp.]
MTGEITRGTTAPNRLRRCDRWLAGPQAGRLRRYAGTPVVVDLGYGASPVTAMELRDRLRRVRPDVEVVGIEIDPERVAAAAALAGPGLRFQRGGFEIPLLGGARPLIVRAFNVLRQYAEADVPAHWSLVCSRLAAGGLFVDGTCDEIGRRASWIGLTPAGPQTLTLSWRLRGLDAPSEIAERLPKALIHRNLPGEPVHAFLAALDDQWRRHAAHAGYGVRQRFIATAAALRVDGWPLRDAARWRLGELTIDWAAVAPRGPGAVIG